MLITVILIASMYFVMTIYDSLDNCFGGNRSDRFNARTRTLSVLLTPLVQVTNA